MKILKIVFVGDDLDKSKTKMLNILTANSNNLSDKQLKTVFDSYEYNIQLGIEEFQLNLYDTSGQEEYDRLRPLSYSNANLFVLVFDKAHPISFENISAKWFPELAHFSPNTPIVLVGLNNPTLNQAVSDEDIKQLTKRIGAKGYFDFDLTSNANDKILEKSVALIPHIKLNPLPPFFKNFKAKEIWPHVDRVVQIGKGSRQPGNFLCNTPVDVLTSICDYVGSDLTPDKKALSYFNRLLLLNVKNSLPKKLKWNKALTLANNEKLQIYPEKEDKTVGEKFRDGVDELVTKFKNFF